MAEDASKDLGVGDSSGAEKKDNSSGTTKKRKGFLSRIWNGVFRSHGDDFEKRLQYISKEEASVLARTKTRSLNSRRMTRNLIIFSVFFEVIAVGYAIMTTRSLDLNWKMRAFRVLPMFLMPALSSAAYSGLVSFMRMCDRKDLKTLERLRAERQAKIDELKERTNYYITQQLIQRYDPDPAAKAAAATVLASKLGADSGLKVYVGDDTGLNASTRKSNDVQYGQSSGLRNRKQLHTRSSSTGSTLLQHSDAEMPHGAGRTGSGASEHNQPFVVDHQHHEGEGSATHDGGWVSRIAALLVGEDPTQSYALICSNCHMHNGLARKEELPYITYYCPHCHVLNKSKQLEEHVSSSNSPNMSSLRTVGSSDTDMVAREIASVSDVMSTRNSPVSPASEIEEVSEVVEPGN